jgi:hypothetical protein
MNIITKRARKDNSFVLGGEIRAVGIILLALFVLESVFASEVDFTSSSVSWGSGYVTSEEDYAILDSEAGTVVGGSWTPTSNFFVLENIGEDNVTLNLKSSINADNFIGGTNPSFEWKVVDLVSSCVNISNTEFTDVNTTSEGARICDVFYNDDLIDEVRVYFRLTIPSNAIKREVQSATITAIISAI